MALQTRSYSSPETSNGYILSFTLTENSIDTNSNNSNISYNLILKSKSSSFSQFHTGWSISLDGEIVSSKSKSDAMQISLGKNSSVTIVSGNLNIKHDSDGKKSVAIAFSIDQNKTSYSAGPISVSGQSMQLTDIPRATKPTVNNAIIGSKVEISLPRASNYFTHTLSYTFGTAYGNIGSGFEEKAEWDIPICLANQIPTANTGNGTITCKTYNGNTLIGTVSVAFSASIPDNAVPIINSIDISEAIAGVAEKFNAFIQRRSQLKIKISATGIYGSSISDVKVILDSKEYSGSDVTTDVVINSGSVKVSVIATDSRGKTTSDKTTITVLPYSPPTVNMFNAFRADEQGKEKNTGEYMAYQLDYQISSVNDLNTALYQIQYKQINTENWNILTMGNEFSKVVNDVSATDVLKSDYPYNVRLMLKDFFETVYINISDIPTGFTLVDYDNDGKGISFGAVCNSPGFHVHLPVDYYGVPLSDFICEIGENENWIYRKWHSGIAECWGRLSITTNYSLKWSDAVFVSRDITPNVDYPFIFTERPYEFARIYNEGMNSWIYTDGINTESHCAGYHGARATQVTTETQMTVDIFVIGKWK